MLVMLMCMGDISTSLCSLPVYADEVQIEESSAEAVTNTSTEAAISTQSDSAPAESSPEPDTKAPADVQPENTSTGSDSDVQPDAGAAETPAQPDAGGAAEGEANSTETAVDSGAQPGADSGVQSEVVQPDAGAANVPAQPNPDTAQADGDIAADIQPDAEANTGTQPDGTAAEEKTETVSNIDFDANGECKASLSTKQRYAMAAKKALQYQAAVGGGTAPYSVTFRVKVNKKVVHEETVTMEETGKREFTYMPAEFGSHKAEIVVTDQSGKQINAAAAAVPVAVCEEENEQVWASSVSGVSLTGDWRRDLAAVAGTQVGYRESQRNFIIDEEDEQHGYTRYGHWYGSAYEEWAGAFAAFCLNYAGIPENVFPREADSVKWKNKLGEVGLYQDDEDGYTPEQGDLVFLNDSGDNTPDSVGIVERVSKEENKVYTIGDVEQAVARRSYALSDGRIVGYASMRAAMKRAGILERFEKIDETVQLEPVQNGDVVGCTAYVNGDSVNLRENPGTDSNRIGEAAQGTQLTILAVAVNGEETWYQVEIDGMTAYIRSDFVTVESGVSEDGEPAEEGAPAEAVEPTEEDTTAKDGESAEEDASAEEVESSEENDTAQGESAITEQPRDYEGVLGGTAVFTVEAAADASFQWQRSPIGADAWEDIADDAVASGWNTPELSVVITKESAGYLYRCAVTRASSEEAAETASLFSWLTLTAHAAEGDAGKTMYSDPAGINLLSGNPSVETARINIAEVGESLRLTGATYQIDTKDVTTVADGRMNLEGTNEKEIQIWTEGTAGTVNVYLNGIQAPKSEISVSADTSIIVNGESTLGNITLKPGQELTLVLDAELELGTITVPEGAVLTVQGSGTLTAQEISGVGTIEIQTGVTAKVAGAISAGMMTIGGEVSAVWIASSGDLNISGTVSAVSSGTITAGGNITVASGAVVSDAALLGFGADAVGNHTLTLEAQTRIDRVSVVGAGEDTNARVVVTDAGVYLNRSTIIRDYVITWMADGETVVPEGAPIAYRVWMGDTDVIRGTLRPGEEGVYLYEDLQSDTVDLTEITAEKKFYTFKGWTFGELSDIEDIQNFTSEPFSEKEGDVTLSAVFAPKRVELTLDLNYTPEGEGATSVLHTYGGPEEEPLYVDETVALYGDTIAFETPFRFGYDLIGFTQSQTPGDEDARYGTSVQPDYTVVVSEDLWDEAADCYKCVLYAEWKPIELQVTLVLDSDQVAVENTEISLDGETYYPVTGGNGWIYNADDNAVYLTQRFNYGDMAASFNDGFGLPLLRDNTPSDSLEPVPKDFECWKTNDGGLTVDEESQVVLYNAGAMPSGLLTHPADKNEKEYQELLKTGGLVLLANWKNRYFTLHTGLQDTAAAGWSVKVNGETAEPDENGDLEVSMGDKVTYVAPNNSEMISFWDIKDDPGENQEEDPAQARIYAEETALREYTFTMPQNHVTAEYVGKAAITWLTDWGDYAFGDVTLDGITTFGFTLTLEDGTVETYRWPGGTAFNFTSIEETSHQIKVDRAMTLNLDKVKLGLPRNGADEALGRENLGYYLTGHSDEQEYANLLIDNSLTNPNGNSYAVIVQQTGDSDSSIYMIGQTDYSVADSNIVNLSTLRINGGTIHTSGIVLLGALYLNQADLRDADNPSGKFLVFLNASPLDVTGGSIITSRSVRTQAGASKTTRNGCLVLANANSGVCTFRSGAVARIGQAIYAGGTVNVSASDIQAGRINTGWGGAVISSGAKVRAGFLGNNFYIHASSTVINTRIEGGSTVTIDPDLLPGESVLEEFEQPGIRVGVLTVSGGSKLSLLGDASLRIYCSARVTGTDSEVNVGGAVKAVAIGVENPEFHTNNGLYSDTAADKRFFLQVDNGGKMEISGGINESNFFGLQGANDCHVSVFGEGSTLTVNGDTALYNRVEVTNGGVLTVNGDLTVAQDLIVGGTATFSALNTSMVRTDTVVEAVSGGVVTADNIYHVGDGTITGEDGLPCYYKIEVSEDSILQAVGADSVVGSKTADDRTDVVYSRSNIPAVKADEIVRDILVRYILPDGYENAADNPSNIRVVNDGTEAEVTLEAPGFISGINLELGADCWHLDDEDNTQITGWKSAGMYSGESAEAAVDFGKPIQIATLTARPTKIPVQLVTDKAAEGEAAPFEVEYLEADTAGADEWTAAEYADGYYQIPAGAEVRVNTDTSYAGCVVAASIIGDVSVPLTVSEERDGTFHTFDMGGAVSVRLYVTKTIELYLDLSDIVVGVQDDNWGFWLTAGMAEDVFFRYAGNYRITQKDPDAVSPYTLTIHKDNTDGPELTMTGVTVPDNCSVDTAYLPEGGILKLANVNSIRNIRTEAGKNLTVQADSEAVTYFVLSDYYGGVYRTVIGHSVSGSFSGSVTVRGGTYYMPQEWRSTSGNQNTIGIFGFTNTSVTLEDITVKHPEGGYKASTSPYLYIVSNTQTLTVNRCCLEDIDWGAVSALGARNIIIDSSDVTLSTGYVTTNYTSNPSAINCGSVNQTLAITGGSKVTLKTSDTKPYGNALYATTASSISVTQNSTLNVGYSVRIGTVNVEAGSVLNVTDSTGKGYPMAAETINNAGNITAGWVLGGGFATTSNLNEDYLTYGTTAYTTGGTITNSGIITAIGGSLKESGGQETVTEGAIGGSRGTRIINSGTLSASSIGTLDYLVGFTKFNCVYKADEQPSPGAVTITGGEISGFDELCGSAIDISGGKVKGNEASRITAAPGGSITVSGGTAEAAHITAADGNISITTKDKTITNAPSYDQGLPGGVNVGVYAHETLLAENLSITDGALVSAKLAGSNAALGKTGSMIVTSKAQGTFLYTESYGALGDGDAVVDTDNGQCVSAVRSSSINYVLGGDDVTNHPDNPVNFTYESGRKVAVYAPTRPGYSFEGWFGKETLDETDELPRDTQNGETCWLFDAVAYSVNLYAKWKPVEVTFHLYEAAGEEAAQLGEAVVIPFGDRLFSKIILADYVQGTQGVSLFQFEDTALGGQVGADTVVTVAMVEEFLRRLQDGDPDNDYLRLNAKWVTRLKEIDLYLNRTNGLPEDARFSENYSFSDYIRGYLVANVLYGQKLGEVSYARGVDPEFPSPLATGYIFGGWFDAAGTVEATADTVATGDMPSQYYACWTPITYTIEFDAGDNGKTAAFSENAVEPSPDAEQTLTGQVSYDSVIQGSLTIAEAEKQPLPAAWKQGYVFTGWSILTGGDGEAIPVTDETVMKWTHEEGGSVTAAAEYEPTQITYNLNGGKWTGEADGDEAYAHVDPEAALPGYTKVEDGYEIYTDGKEAEDYRNVLSRPGYTFTGWYTDEECTQELQHGPNYQHVALYAGWKANSYRLTLNSLKAQENEYKIKVSGKDGFSTDSVSITGIVTMDQPIDAENWPGRENLYVQYSENDTLTEGERLLLGYTFESLNPNVYDNVDYPHELIDLTNAGLVLNNGQTFTLPEGIDPPDGSELELYALYREVSLIFVEYARFSDTEIHRVVKAVEDWHTYQEPPYTTNKDANQDIIARGYTFVNWVVGDEVSATVYTEEAYSRDKESYKEIAANLGIYDIYVYSVYRPQVTMDGLELTASAGKNAKTINQTVTTAPLPESMVSGKAYYEVELSDGLKLASSDEIDANKTKASWDDGNSTPDNTFAVKLEILNANGNVQFSIDNLLDTQGSRKLLTEDLTKELGAGMKLRLTLSNADRLKGGADYTLNLRIYWDESDENGQCLKLPIKISSEAAVYDVMYHANLPQGCGDLSPEYTGEWEDGSITVEQTYGAAYQHPGIALEGFELAGWDTVQNPAEGTDTSAGENFELDSYGACQLYAQWERQDYELSADAETRARWNVSWSAAYMGANETLPGDMTPLGSNPAQVPYRGTVKLEPESGVAAGELYPEFITDAANPEWSLLDAEKLREDPSGCWFSMPGADRELVYSRVRVLDLAEGTITINEGSYTQGGETCIWHGDYVIRQTDSAAAATGNTLTVNALTADATLTLETLNISAADSIVINGNITADLNGSITAKNVRVPSGSVLTLNGTSPDSSALILTPDAGRAAIGGGQSETNGAVSLTGVRVSLDMPVGSTASGIGAGAGASGGSAVALSNVEIDVATRGNALGSYTGTLLGGSGAEKVTLNTVTVNASGSEALPSENINILQAKDAEVTGSTINAKYPVKCENTLVINNSNVAIEYLIGNAVGLTAGTIQVNGNSVVTTNSYSGQMKIMDAAAEVTTTAGRLLEVANGSVTLNEDGYTQGSAAHTGAPDIVLLDERRDEAPSGAGSAVTVNRDATITLGSGTVTVAGIAYGAAEHPVSVTLKDGTGKALAAAGDISGTGSLILNGMSIDAGGHNVGSTDGTVTFQGTNTVTADTIGALGSAWDGTAGSFTTVTLTDGASLRYTGSLVRDWYKIAYDLPGGYTNGTDNPYVFRTEESGKNAGMSGTYTGTKTVNPATYKGSADGFDYWYLLKNDTGDAEIRLGGENSDKLSADTWQKNYDAGTAGYQNKVLTLYTKLSYLKLESSATLTAYEEKHTPQSNETKTFEFDFSDTSDLRALLVGKTLYVKSVTPSDDISVVSSREIAENASTAGSNYANSTFALTGAVVSTGNSGNTGDGEVDLLTPGTEIGSISKEGKLTVSLHNANAISKSGTAGTVTLVLSTNEEPDAAAADLITITLTINRVPSQISATVPLYVCMYAYGGDGHVVTPADDAYGITNKSGCPVQVTSITGTELWSLMDSDQGLKAGELYLKLADQVVTAESKDTSGSRLWRISTDKTASNVLSIPIQAVIAGGSVNEDGESKACTVTYTVGIAAD